MATQIQVGSRFVEITPEHRELLWDILTGQNSPAFGDWLESYADLMEKEVNQDILARKFEEAFGKLQYVQAFKDLAELFHGGRDNFQSDMPKA